MFNIAMSCTLVTAYYAINSKFPKEQYVNWMRTLLQLNTPIVLFTQDHMEDLIRDLRGNRLLHLVVLPFQQLTTWSLYKNHWIKHYEMDPEKGVHSPELYSVWAEKAFFVERAIIENPFMTEHFFWCDIGAFRNPNIDSRILSSFPTITHLSHDHILLQSVGDLKPTDRLEKEDGIRGERISENWNEIRLVGGLWGGGASACLYWKDAYQAMLERYFAAGRFAGKDQIVMLSTYMEQPHLAKVVQCTRSDIDPWFFLEYLLSDREEAYQINETYTIPIVSVNVMGGLGNQLFQIAAAYAYAKKEGGRLLIPHILDNGDRPVYWNSILQRFRPYLSTSIPYLPHHKEKEATLYDAIPTLSQEGIYLEGYMQSSKYFVNDRIKSEIRALLAPPPAILNEVFERYRFLMDNKDRVVVVHARRTDYLKNHTNIMVHGPLHAEYYKLAIQRMKKLVKDPIWLLTSDDNRYWIEIEKDLDLHAPIFLMNEGDINSFVLLQQFKNVIMSNSTFIWWATWLANATNVMVPSKWFGPWGPSQYEDIYEAHWQRI